MNDRWHGFSVYSWNIPQPRPGVYMLTHLPDGMRYVGATKNVANRIAEHASNSSNVPQLREVMRRYPGKYSKATRHAFLVEPLWYATDPLATKKACGLTAVEIAMIDAYDSINHGWNQSLGPVNVVALAKTRKAKAKRRAKEASPETKALRSKVMLERWADPEYKARLTGNNWHTRHYKDT